MKENMTKKIKLDDCPDCGVKAGKEHDINCDVQRCSDCGAQYLQCDENCDHDSSFARWTGFWPGSLEADKLGIDLNEFYRQGLNKKIFIKP